MSHCKLQILTATLLIVSAGATAAFADRDLAPGVPGSAAGDWTCRLGTSAAGTLSVRASSYELTRAGSAMAGEYRQAAEHITIVNGPLRGYGIDSGVLASAPVRTLEFATASGAVLACVEVL